MTILRQQVLPQQLLVKVDMVCILRVVLGIPVCTGNLVITICIVLITLKGHIYYITLYLLTLLLEWIYKLLIITFGFYYTQHGNTLCRTCVK